MANKSKKSVIKDNFELLKDAFSTKDGYDSTLDTLTENVIVPMLELDLNEGCRMWEYLLKHYWGKISPVFYHKLADGVVEYADYNALIKAFSINDTICEYVFKLDPYEDHLFCEWFIRDLIGDGKYDLAEKLIKLFIQNNNGDNDTQNNAFKLFQQIIPSSDSRWQLNSEGIDFISRWINVVTDKKKHAQLELALIDLIDAVENDAPKGGMPFSLFTSEGGFERLVEEKKKQANRNDDNPTIHSSFDDYMEERRIKRKDIGELGTAQTEFKRVFDIDALRECQEELNGLIGLNEVKKEVTSLVNLIQIQRMRAEMGLVIPDISHHLVFTGNPGTGKTTVARIIGKLYHAIGILSKGHFIEVDRSGLVAGYVGQTAIKTIEVIESALGGVLFIDEAYSLYSESGNDFGHEAIDTLLKAMEDHRDNFVVIVAGYESLMPQFINSNPGLKSRFNKYINFLDYNKDELMAIFQQLLEKNQYIIDYDAGSALSEYFTKVYTYRDSNFGNGRVVRNIFEKVISSQANRLVHSTALSESNLKLITIDDIKTTIQQDE